MKTPGIFKKNVGGFFLLLKNSIRFGQQLIQHFFG